MKDLGAGSKGISGLTAISSLADADVLAIVNGGSTKKVDLNALTAYFESRGRVNNASVAAQTLGATDTYITGSDVTIPAGRLQVKTKYHAAIQISKTAGAVAPVLNVRIGTAGTTSDSSKHGFTLGAAGTAVSDNALIEVFLVFRTIGSGTSAVTWCTGTLIKNAGTTTGFIAGPSAVSQGVSSGFDSTVAGLKIGVSFTGGTSFAGTVNGVDAMISNLA